MGGAASGAAARAGLTLRPVRIDELEACADVLRRAIDDYAGRLGQPPIDTDMAPLVRLYRHLATTDPDRFVVAARDAGGGTDEVVAFGSAVQRERLWFLSMLFVAPDVQAAGLGRAILSRIMPPGDGPATAADGGSMATATDSAQPISNALYSTYGIVPRIPLLNLTGLPVRDGAFEPLPSGVRPVAFADVGPSLAAAVDDLDRELLGVAHPIDHGWLASENRRGWLYLGPDGAILGYGYGTEAGRIGPIAVRDAALVAPVLGHLLTAIAPRGAFAAWVPGSAGPAVVGLLRAGFRLDPFPILLCWDRPFADFSRYLPISPGLL